MNGANAVTYDGRCHRFRPVIAYSPVLALVERFPASVRCARDIKDVEEFLKSCLDIAV